VNKKNISLTVWAACMLHPERIAGGNGAVHDYTDSVQQLSQKNNPGALRRGL
jgi:hypothetical protein